jgi:CheY-like chemotaxis protein
MALTANAQAEDRDACLAAGMDGLLTKPLDAKAWARRRPQYPQRVSPRLRPEPAFPTL